VKLGSDKFSAGELIGSRKDQKPSSAEEVKKRMDKATLLLNS
jgi:hypothetical protein